VHDVSWGTKGDNKPAASLGAVSTTGKKNEVEVEVPTSEKDINGLYEDAIHVLNTKPPKVEAKVDTSTQQEDYYRNFRTNVLLAWTLTNGLLAAAITSTSGSGNAQKVVSGYMAFLLFSVAGLACKSLPPVWTTGLRYNADVVFLVVRFVGSSAYMIIRLFAGE
jgi:chitin synthase